MVQCTQLYFIQNNGQILIADGNCGKIVKMKFRGLVMIFTIASWLMKHIKTYLAQHFFQWRDLILLISIN